MTEKEYLAYKIPILMKEGKYSKQQAVAIAFNMYSKEHKNKQQGGTTYLPMRSEEQEAQMERYKLLRASALPGFGVKSDYVPTVPLTEEDRLKAMEAYKDLRASALPGYKVNTGYVADLRPPDQAAAEYLEYRKALLGNSSAQIDYQQGGYYSNYNPFFMENPGINNNVPQQPLNAFSNYAMPPSTIDFSPQTPTLNTAPT